MNIRPYLYASALLAANALSVTANAQDETDALRYSYLSPQATARSIGFGGAVGALGGDFSSLSVNPAGIGVYRRSEFTFTPSLKIVGTTGKYQGTETRDNDVRFTINNMGVVFTGAAEGQRYERSKWKAVSFGIGINRIADFNQNYSYGGQQTPWQGKGDNDPNHNSGAEVFSLDGTKNSDQDVNTFAGLGYQSYLTFRDSAGDYYPVTIYTNKVNQQRVVEQKGGITDINISLGANYMEKLMLGMTLGLPSVVYKRNFTYSETDASNDPNNNFASFDYTESLVTRGTGVNLKLGAIYKPADAFRLGVAFHTPTYFSLKDVMDASITTNTEGYKASLNEGIDPITTVVSGQRVYEYNLWTPWRAVVSAAAIAGKYGFISVDYEYTNYASARYNFSVQDRQYQKDVNSAIKNNFTGASNLRVGVEGRMDIVSARLGFGYYGNPYKNTSLYGDGQRLSFSAGLGFRIENWFVDIGVSHTVSKQQENPYVLNYATPIYSPVANINSSATNAALTFGVKF